MLTFWSGRIARLGDARENRAERTGRSFERRLTITSVEVIRKSTRIQKTHRYKVLSEANEPR